MTAQRMPHLPRPAIVSSGAEITYPEYLEGQVFLRDGTPIAVRPIRPTDASALQDMVARASPEDLRLRFFNAMQRLPEGLVARLTRIDYEREMAFVALDPAEPAAVTGVARLIADPPARAAEYAILVRTDWKGKGLGYALMRRLIDFARDRQIETVYGEILRENSAMLKMTAELGFTSSPNPNDPAVVDVRRNP